MQPNNDLGVLEDRLALRPLRKIGIDQGYDRLKASARIRPENSQKEFLLPVIKRFQHPVVEGEAREPIAQMHPQDREVERHA